MNLHGLTVLKEHRSFPPRVYEAKYSDFLVKNLSFKEIIGTTHECGTNHPHNNNPNAGCLFCLRYNPTGTLLATTTADSIQIFDGYTGKYLHCLQDHIEIVTSIVWLHEANYLFSQSVYDEVCRENAFFSSSLDKTIKLWKNFKPVLTLKEHNDWIRCLGLSFDNNLLVSGCVSSVILGWDVPTGKVLFGIQNAHESQQCPDLNTINSLQFCHDNANIFLSGARDGVIKMWDVRCVNKSVHSVQAHNAKLNTLTFTYDDRMVLSAGRDSAIRLWDARKFSYSDSTLHTPSLLMQYNKHICSGYNISCTFLNNERHIATGSEDKLVYVYDTATGQVCKKLQGHTSIVHLVHASDHHPLELASSSIDSCGVTIWQPESSTEEPAETAEKKAEDAFASIHRSAVESLMKKHGDKILRIFHANNFTFSNPLDWQSLLQNVNTDSEQADLLKMITDMAADFATALSFYRPEDGSAEHADRLQHVQSYLISRQANREMEYEARYARENNNNNPQDSSKSDKGDKDHHPNKEEKP